MAETCTTTEVVNVGTVKKIAWAWQSTAAVDGGTVGAVPGATTSAVLDGKIIALCTVPLTSPTDDYDVTITDADGYDVLCGAGLNRDTANTETVAETSLGAVAGSRLTLHIAAAGYTKTGTVTIWLR